MIRTILSGAVLAASLAVASTLPAGAHDMEPGMAHAGDVMIHGAVARATIGPAPNSAVFMTLTTEGEADRLVAASTPAARMVELHESKMADGVMQMSPVEGGIAIEPGTETVLKPGGLHIMLMGVTAPLEEGGTIPLTLTFEKAGTVEMVVPIGKATAGHGHSH